MPDEHSSEQVTPPELGKLTIRLFGPMKVEVSGQPLSRLRSRKGKWLLAILALRSGRDVDREWLAGALWPDDHVADAKRSLRQTVFDLRAALGSDAWRLSSESSGSLRLRLENASVDALEFDELMARGDTASLDAAIQLYRGPLLEDSPVEWALEARAAREESYYRALRTLAADASAHRDFVSSVGYLRRAAEAQPFDENVLRALMEALYQAGDAPEALIVFRKFRERLWQEMSISPSEGTSALHRRILHRRKEPARPPAPSSIPGRASSHQGSMPPARPAPRPRPLPVPLTDLIGREDEVGELRDRLESGRLVTLTGAGGIGKTRLALRAAAELQHDLEGGSVFVDLTAITDAALAPDSVRQALGLPDSTDGRDIQETLAEHLASRETLLVLDNCERLVSVCASLADRLLSRCPGLRILATSRHALGLRGEVVFRVPSLALPPSESVPQRQRFGSPIPDASTYAAIRLFVERARASGASFELTPRTVDFVVAICRRLEGIPLAIELAAARVRAVSVSDVNSCLKKNFDLLQGGASWGDKRHQSLRAVFDWSWSLLSCAEQSVLAALSVFSGGWTLEAAEAVCSTPTEDGGRRRGREGGADEVLDLLTSLVDKSLVVYLPPCESEELGIYDEGPSSSGAGRYRLLEPARQFAEERLTEAGQRDVVMRRDLHLSYFLALAEAEPGPTEAQQREAWLERLNTERGNLRAALDWSIGVGASSAATELLKVKSTGASNAPSPSLSRGEAGLRLCGAIWRLWSRRGDYSEGRQWLAQALSRSPRKETRARAKALNGAGVLAKRQGDYAAARTLFEESLAIVRAQGDRRFIAGSLNNLGGAAAEQGDYPSARPLFEEALQTARDSGERRLNAVLTNNLGLMAREMGDYPSARALVDEALRIARELGDRWLAALALHDLGDLAGRQGDYASARDLYIESLLIRRELGDRPGIAVSLEGLAFTTRYPGSAIRAARLYGAAKRIREDIGSPMPPVDRRRYEEQVAAARAMTRDDEAFDAAWKEGRGLTADQAIDLALSDRGE